MTFIKGHPQSNTGRTHWKKGEHISPSTEFKKGMGGTLSWNWKGDKVGIKPLHTWVKKHLPKPDRCDFCDRVGKVELSNKTGNYMRDFCNWQWLCPKCHRNFDGNSYKAWITRRKNGTDKFYGNQYTKGNQC